MVEVKNHRLGDRRQAFLHAARDLFVRQGYETTSLADIVDAAGGSLATLYKLFGNKAGLLNAIVHEEKAIGVGFIRDAAAADTDPATALYNLAEAAFSYYTDPEAIRFMRLMIAVSIAHPECGQEYFDCSISQSYQEMEELFRKWEMRGIVLNYSPRMLAEMFFSLIAYDLQIQAISMRKERQLTEENLRKRIDFFLKGAGLA
ncbi:TetR/AcrR family transcriptional regulator [Altericroceibacterium spongiae]|uniref:TetR/AcrR family transcriptional regulator n=1 Tax=Altericroceibacterium spongiae TaxID=2320269 RepID=A0A420ERS2_9SPHN|nr:TetR/AcrR family transcriptional regulator [Altericroceibacterium spongiae]RKF23323.1 TetR/AcrR family transcriptional regulator [Altericroceibacterium spongiae]